MDITSDMLDVDPNGAGISGFDEEEGGGDELSKRVEKFGFPVGKGALACPMIQTSIVTVSTGEAAVNPVLLCKITKGQHLKLRCIAKKVGFCALAVIFITNLFTLRGLQKSTSSGPHAQRLASSTIRIISCGIHRIGMR